MATPTQAEFVAAQRNAALDALAAAQAEIARLQALIPAPTEAAAPPAAHEAG